MSPRNHDDSQRWWEAPVSIAQLAIAIATLTIGVVAIEINREHRMTVVEEGRVQNAAAIAVLSSRLIDIQSTLVQMRIDLAVHQQRIPER